MALQGLIAQKRQQIAKLEAQIQVLEELAAENDGPTRRRTSAAKDRRGPRGVGQDQLLAVLRTTPQRMKDIARAANVAVPTVSGMLARLKKAGKVEQSGRGLYKLASGGSDTVSTTQKPRNSSKSTLDSGDPRSAVAAILQNKVLDGILSSRGEDSA